MTIGGYAFPSCDLLSKSSFIDWNQLKTYLRKRLEGKITKKPSSNKMSSIYIPARPFMKLNERDLDRIKSIKELTKRG